MTNESSPLDEEEKRQIELAVDTQVRIIAAVYEKANAYTNLIIVAGYAGYFALWQMTKEYLGRKQAMLSALLILISIMGFVIFEIYKAHYHSRLLRKYQEAIWKPENKTTLLTLAETMNSFEQAERQSALHFVTFWNVTFWVTTVTGVSAGIVLCVAYAHRLLQ